MPLPPPVAAVVWVVPSGKVNPPVVLSTVSPMISVSEAPAAMEERDIRNPRAVTSKLLHLPFMVFSFA
jgi:hypothetical protein